MRLISRLVILAMLTSASSALAHGKIIKAIAKPLPIYDETGQETGRIKAPNFPAQVIGTKGASWLIYVEGNKNVLVRRADVIYEDNEPCVYAKNPAGAAGVGMGGVRAGSVSGAGSGGGTCIPTNR